jgi:hypothetical protein
MAAFRYMGVGKSLTLLPPLSDIQAVRPRPKSPNEKMSMSLSLNAASYGIPLSDHVMVRAVFGNSEAISVLMAFAMSKLDWSKINFPGLILDLLLSASCQAISCMPEER